MVPLRAGEHVLGVRASSEELVRLLETAFASRLVRDASPPPNYSVLVPQSPEEGPRQLLWLFDGHARWVRTRSMRRLLDALWHHLDAHEARAVRSSMLVAATVLVKDGCAHLVPSTWRRRVLVDERAWERHGFRLVDRPWMAFDPGAGTVTVPPSGLAWSRRLGQRLHAVAPAGAEAVARPAGEFAIVTWTVRSGPASLAEATVRAADDVLDRVRHGAPLVSELAALLSRLTPVETSWSRLRELPAMLARLHSEHGA